MNPVDELNRFRSWKLHRLSPTTYAQDVGVTCPVARANLPELRCMLRRGSAYRCRIGNGPYFYADTADAATAMAIEHETKTKKRDS